MNEQQIKMAAKLYKCRDVAKSFLNNEYESKLAPYKALIQSVMRANKIDVLPALLQISKTKTFEDHEMGQIMYYAAAVELIEPSK